MASGRLFGATVRRNHLLEAFELSSAAIAAIAPGLGADRHPSLASLIGTVIGLLAA